MLAAVSRWAASDPRIRGVTLVGSRARGKARSDSDVDFVVLTEAHEALGGDTSWYSTFGSVELVRSEQWGQLAERRLRRPSGLEVEIGIAPVTWAKVDPIDSGTREVVSHGGCEILYDPDGLLAALMRAVDQH